MTEQVFLFGKVLEIDEALKNGIKLRMYMMEVGKQVQLMVKSTFDVANNIYEWLEIGNGVVDAVYGKLYGAGIDYLHEIGITEFDSKEIELIVCEFSSKYEELHLSIVMNKLANEKELRNRGLEGERKEKERRKLEKKFFLEMQGEFLDACFLDALKLVQMIGNVIHFTDVPIRLIEDEDEDKGAELFKLLKKTKLDLKQLYEIAYKIFEADPTEQEYYEYCMLEFPEETDNLLHLQQITGLALQKSILEKALKKMFEKMPHNTEEETLIIKNKLENIQKEVDISNNKIVKKVDQLLYDFDIQERTFCNILFDTREMKRAAEKDFDKLDTICGNLESMSEEECEKKKQLISEEETVIEIKQLFLEKIDNRIKRIWIEEDSEKIIDIFTHTNIYEKSSILQSIKAINDIGRTDDKKRYIDALNGINNDTLCIIRAYKEWENKKTLRKYGLLIVLLALGVCLIPFGIGIIVVLVGAILLAMKLIKVHKMKKTWNLLTLNGEVIHHQMLVDDIKEKNTVKEIVEVKSGEAEKIEIEKAEVASRTVRGVVYESLEKADLARKEHSEIDQLKKELLKTKSQKKRRKIVGNFSEKLQVKDAIKRYDLLLAKVSEKTPISEKIRISYGITVLLTFVLAVFLLMLEPAASSFTVICGVWSGFGVWICAIWKIVQVIRSRNKNYYKNIKYI